MAFKYIYKTSINSPEILPSLIFFDQYFVPLMETYPLLGSKFARILDLLSFLLGETTSGTHCFYARIRKRVTMLNLLNSKIINKSIYVASSHWNNLWLRTSGFLSSTDFPVVVVNLLLWWLLSISWRRDETLKVLKQLVMEYL